MPTARAERRIAAPIEDVFEILTDHANYKRFPGVVRSKLVRQGQGERNGVGAVREIVFGGVWFEEEILVFERPFRMDYLIRRARPPIDHDGGSMLFEETGGGTRVQWTSTFRLPWGGPLSRVLAPATRQGFAMVLASAERQLTR